MTRWREVWLLPMQCASCMTYTVDSRLERVSSASLSLRWLLGFKIHVRARIMIREICSILLCSRILMDVFQWSRLIKGRRPPLRPLTTLRRLGRRQMGLTGPQSCCQRGSYYEGPWQVADAAVGHVICKCSKRQSSFFLSACKSSHSTHTMKQLERHGPCPGEMMALLTRLVLT
jgi:hypothetical protein